MLASRATHNPRPCDRGLARAFAFLGKRWNGVLIATLVQGPAGFAELARAIDGISESVLSDRLNELTKAGIVTRTVLDGPPVSVRYELTPSGAALAPALHEIRRWADAHLPIEE